MKLIDKKHENAPFDVPAGLALALLATGTVEKYTDPEPKRPAPDSSWKVVREPMLCNDGANSNPCYIFARCASCQQTIQMSGPTVHRTQVFRHCGIAEPVPEEIAREYVKALREPRERQDHKIAKRQERERQQIPARW